MLESLRKVTVLKAMNEKSPKSSCLGVLSSNTITAAKKRWVVAWKIAEEG